MMAKNYGIIRVFRAFQRKAAITQWKINDLIEFCDPKIVPLEDDVPQEFKDFLTECMNFFIRIENEFDQIQDFIENKIEKLQ